MVHYYSHTCIVCENVKTFVYLQIVRALEGDVSLEDLNEGVRPGQSMLFSSGSDYDSSPKTSNLNRFRKASLTSPEYSGEYNSPIEGRHAMNQYQAAIDYFHAK